MTVNHNLWNSNKEWYVVYPTHCVDINCMLQIATPLNVCTNTVQVYILSNFWSQLGQDMAFDYHEMMQYL